MKSSILLTIAMVFTLGVFAQRPQKQMYGKSGKPGMEQGRGERQQKIIKELNLTDTQQKQMKELQDGFRANMKALQQKENITVKQQRDEMYTLQQQHRTDMKKILTPEQQEKMNALRTEQGNKMRERQSKGFEKMASELKLTEAQKAKITPLQEKHRSEMQALMQNDNLDRATKEKQVKALLDAHQKDISKLLTTEQQTQWEEMKKNRPVHHKGAGKMGQGRPDFI